MPLAVPVIAFSVPGRCGSLKSRCGMRGDWALQKTGKVTATFPSGLPAGIGNWQNCTVNARRHAPRGAGVCRIAAICEGNATRPAIRRRARAALRGARRRRCQVSGDAAK